ncbi:MAG TPA: long-chain fatty acid--CoA ligase [Chitinophagales bacterium]|nr:long-chain fatty acid--CoA ligase [Chitinophagales bacterium]
MDIKRLFDIPAYQKNNYPKDDALCAKINGEWRKYSIGHVIEMSNQAGRAFIGMGLKKDDKIAIISNNRPEWNFIDYGAMQAGLVNVPVYPTISEEDYVFIFNDAQVKAVFVSNGEMLQKVNNIRVRVPSILAVYTFDKIFNTPHWEEFLNYADVVKQSQLDAISATVDEHDVATIIYTSGTTGTPKGVMLTHRNVIADIEGAKPIMPVDQRHRALSFLPLNHSFEKLLVYLYTAYGVSVYYAESMETIGDNLRDVKPHIFTAVPRLLEKVYERIVNKGYELKGIKRALFFWALRLGEQWDNQNPPGGLYMTQLNLARKLIFSKWKEALGGNVMMVVTGAAPMQQKLSRVFTAAGIVIMEGYGLTETAPAVSVNRFNLDENKIGSVGKPLDGVQVEIADDGEILVKGDIVMKGYYNRPDLTAEVIDADGWFHTGDIGEKDSDGFLKITDRKKELFKTSGGKYVAPQPIENKLKESNLIEQAMVVGNARKYVGALVVPSITNLTAWCEKQNLKFDDVNAMLAAEEVKEEIKKVIDRANQTFSQTEQVKRFALIPSEWTVQTGELTPTLKPKRKIIEKKFEKEIESMYV